MRALLSTNRRQDALACLFFLLVAVTFLWDAFQPDTVLLSRESLQRSLPWSTVLDREPAHNRFVGDQPRIFYPYLLEAARIYAGEQNALWTSLGGGGQPFLGNISSSLFHPLTLLAAAIPMGWVPLVQALIVLVGSAWFTWRFLRRLGVSPGAALFGGLAFGFGGHQVLWLQYALSHTLLALPFCFLAVERVVEDRSRRRVAVLGVGIALLVLGGHPETGLVAGLVVGLWALWRLWDSHGRGLVFGSALLGLGLSAIQWMPFLEYAQLSHGLHLREVEASKLEGGVTLGASAVFAVFFLAAVALLRVAAKPGVYKQVLVVLSAGVALVVARRMGMAIAGGAVFLPELYGNPLGGAAFTGAQDYPGLNAGFAGVLPPILLTLAYLVGFGGGFIRFMAIAAFLLWGAACHVPGVEGLVRLVPGLSEVGPTRLLGPVGFLTACGGALFLDKLTSANVSSSLLSATGRVALVIGVSLAVTFMVLRIPVDPHGGRTIKAGLRAPDHTVMHDGGGRIMICLDLPEPVDDLRIWVDGLRLRSGPARATTPDNPLSVPFAAQRTEEGRHRLRVEAVRDGHMTVIADQPLAISRPRQLSHRDLAMVGLGLALLGWLVARRRPAGAWVAAAVVGVDVLSLGAGYNPVSAAEDLFPPTESVSWLLEQQAEQGPFRVFSEGNILPPDTQFAVGLEHLLSYDNLGYHRTYQLLIEVPLRMDAFATFSFSEDTVDYGSPRFDLLDVRYVLTDLRTDLGHIPGMSLAHESEVRIWENGGNLGRVFLVGKAAVMGPETRAELMQLDPGEVAFLEQEWTAPLGGQGTARVVSHEAGEVLVETDSDGPALLVFTENFAPGWEASIDGEPYQDTRPAYAAWQIVPVEAGQHEVRLRYAPNVFAWGRALSIASLVVLLLMLTLPRRLG